MSVPTAPVRPPMITVREGNQPESAFRDARKNVEINIGKACNNRCVFCIDGLPKREDRSYMPWEQMQAELTRWYEDGYRRGLSRWRTDDLPRICDSVAYARTWASRASRSPPMRRNCVCRTSRIGSLPPV